MRMKTFILNINVLLRDPDTIFSFHDNIVSYKAVVTMTVVGELDLFKKFNDERGRLRLPYFKNR